MAAVTKIKLKKLRKSFASHTFESLFLWKVAETKSKVDSSFSDLLNVSL